MPSDTFSTQGSSAASDAKALNKYSSTGSFTSTLIDGGTTGDPFWSFAKIDETHFSKSYPYQLQVVRKEGAEYTIKETFTLPINPIELSISSPFAITTSVTLGGIVEEHNGSPIKLISISGSTGLLPLKGSPDVSTSLAGAIFGGTLKGVTTIVAGVKSIVAAGNISSAPHLISNSSLDTDLKWGTGYFQFMLLRNFLESYVATKKTSQGRDLRLAFAIWKDSEAWLVTPISFDLKRSASSALEYMYSIQLKAWKRYVPAIGQGSAIYNKSPLVRNPNALASALNSMRGARDVLLGAKSVLTGFRADVDAVLFLPIREAGMFIKEAIGVGLTALDLPLNIIRDAKRSILEFTSSGQGQDVSADAVFEKIRRVMQDLSVITGIAETKQDPLSDAGFGPNNSHPANKYFDNPEKYPAFFDSVQIGQLNSKPQTIKKIVEERERIRKITRLDFEIHRDNILALAVDYADFVGAGGATYSAIYNRPTPVVTRTPTDDDWEVLYQLNQVAINFGKLAASTATDNKNRLTAMEYIAGQAGRSGIPFVVPASAYAVPFPYGSTLEMVSNRYLGTPDRWHEIAVLNNLRPPYVDEEGFTLPLTINGSGNTIQITDGTQLHLGQPVWLASTTINREKRRVSSIKMLSSTVWTIEVDGDSDLEKFTTVGAAEMFAFTPGTVNSLQLLYIPSDKPPAQPDYEPKGNEAIDEFNNFLQVGGADLLLTDRGDLAIMKDGDCKLAVGLANIIQHVKLVLSIEPGTLLRHPDVGFAVVPGTSTADVSAQDILAAAQSSFAGDPTFTGIGSVSIVKSGSSLSISLGLGVAGISNFIPISFAIRA